ncbi:MAG: hypothetical protein R3E02_08945 [Blastomonas sp.]
MKKCALALGGATLLLAACSGGAEGSGEEEATVEAATAYLVERKKSWNEEVISSDLKKQPDGTFEGPARIKDEDGEIEDWTCNVKLPSGGDVVTSYSCFN